jgi:hypothetical protein
VLNASEFLDTASGVGFNISLLAEVAQVVEHGTENAGVDSSSLSLGTTVMVVIESGSGSVVEHLLAKERVASSNLVFRSIYKINPYSVFG